MRIRIPNLCTSIIESLRLWIFGDFAGCDIDCGWDSDAVGTLVLWREDQGKEYFLSRRAGESLNNSSVFSLNSYINECVLANLSMPS